MSSKDWKWFNETIPESKSNSKEKEKQINWYAVASDKEKIKQLVLEDPKVLYKVVGSYSNCMCGGTCGRCEYEETFLFDWIVDAKSLTEKDLCELGDRVQLDWFDISSRVPLSNSSLVKYCDKVDWESISSSYLYEKNDSFVSHNHKNIVWNKVNEFNISSTDIIEDFVFISKYIPLEVALKHELLPIPLIDKHLASIIPHTKTLVKAYNLKDIEAITDINDILKQSLKDHADSFVEKCNFNYYVPKKYPELLSLSPKTNWKRLIEYCHTEINEEFLELYAVDSMNHNSWLALSMSKIPLSDNFVNKYFVPCDQACATRCPVLSLVSRLS